MIGRILVFMSLSLISFNSFSQCAMCKASLESNLDQEDAKGTGINSGILYLVGFPYLLALTVGILIYRNNKRLAK